MIVYRVNKKDETGENFGFTFFPDRFYAYSRCKVEREAGFERSEVDVFDIPVTCEELIKALNKFGSHPY